MGDRISAHVKSLQAVDWETRRQGGGVNDYMELLIKETVTLHKVLSRYLSAPIVEYVMSQVFAAINHRLSEEYGQIELQSQEAKDRMLADVQFLHQKLLALKNVSAPTSMLETLVGEKLVVRKSTLGNSRTTTGANERLRGLLSRGDSNKSLPSPSQSPALPGVLSAPPTPSNGTVADESMGDSNQVTPPPRSSSRNSGMVPATSVTADGDGKQGNALQNDEGLGESGNPISLETLACNGNEDVPR